MTSSSFFTNQDIANYAGDNTPFACGSDIPTVLDKLHKGFYLLNEIPWRKLF